MRGEKKASGEVRFEKERFAGVGVKSVGLGGQSHWPGAGKRAFERAFPQRALT